MGKVFAILVFSILIVLILGLTLYKSTVSQENEILMVKLLPKVEALFEDNPIEGPQRKSRLAADIFDVLQKKNSLDHFAVFAAGKNLVFYWSRYPSLNPQLDFFAQSSFQSLISTYQVKDFTIYSRTELITVELGVYVTLSIALIFLLVVVLFSIASRKVKSVDSQALDFEYNARTAAIIIPLQEQQEQFSASIKNELSQLEQKKYRRTEGLIDRFTGVCRGDILEYRLEKELARSAENNVDLSLLLVRFRGLKATKKTNAAQVMIDEFTHEDLIFEYGDDAFFVILPQSDFDQSLAKTELFIARRDFNLLNGIDEKVVTLLAGISSRNGRLMNSKRLINEVQIAIKRARDQDGKIVGFRPDPMKFRHYLSHTKV